MTNSKSFGCPRLDGPAIPNATYPRVNQARNAGSGTKRVERVCLPRATSPKKMCWMISGSK
jgi:hypothetical protein